MIRSVESLVAEYFIVAIRVRVVDREVVVGGTGDRADSDAGRDRGCVCSLG